jgi:MYXO-CTERM domain-containing protein
MLIVAAPALSQRHVMPRGSFLQAPARSTPALLRQFDTNGEVRRRYMNIFNRNREESRTILSRMKPKELTETHKYPVAFHNETGKWLYRTTSLPRGTMVFVTPEGKPFMKEECGNPIVEALPYPKGEGRLTRAPIDVPKSLDPRPLVVQVSPRPAMELSLEPSIEYNGPVATLPSFDLAERPRVEGGFSMIPEGSPGFLAPPGLPVSDDLPLWLALLLPFLLLFGETDGGPPPSVIGGHHGNPPPPTPLVPETSSWILMAAGGLAAALAARRRRTDKSP